MVLRFQNQGSGKEAESKLNESENKKESKCSDNHTKADANQEAASSSSIPANAQTDNYSFDPDIGYGVDTFASEYVAYDSSNYDASHYPEPEYMNQDFDCVEGHPPHDNTANGHESHRNTTDKPGTGRGVLSLLSKKRNSVAAAHSSSFATTNDALPAKDSDDSSSPGTSNLVANSGDDETDEMKSPLKKPKDNNHSESLDSSDLNQDSNLNSNDVMESSTSNVSLALSNNDSSGIENVARNVDGQNAAIDSFSFSNDTPKEANTGSDAVVHASDEMSSLKECFQGQQNILANTVSVLADVRTAKLDVNVLLVQESDPYLEQDKTTNENDTIVTKGKGIEMSAFDSIQEDKEENEQDLQHGHDAPSLSGPTNSSPPSTTDMSASNVVGKEHSPSETRQNLTIIDVNANEQRASHQDVVVTKSIAMNEDTLVNVSGTARNSQEDAPHIQIGQPSANIGNGKTAKFDRRVSKQIDNGVKNLSNVFVSPTPRHGGRQHHVVRAFSTTTNGGTRIIPEAPVRGGNVYVTSNKSTKNVFQPITPSPPPPSRDAAAKQSDSSSIGTGKAFPNSRSGTIVTSGKAKIHEQMDPKVANKVPRFSSPSLTNAVSSRKTESAMNFDELLQEFTNDFTESGDTVKRSCANLIDLNVKLCTSQSVALRIHAAFDDLLQEAQMLCDL